MFFDPSEYDNYDPEEDSLATSKKSTSPEPKPKRDNKAGLKVLK
jgi:stringent starvation protein B